MHGRKRDRSSSFQEIHFSAKKHVVNGVWGEYGSRSNGADDQMDIEGGWPPAPPYSNPAMPMGSDETKNAEEGMESDDGGGDVNGNDECEHGARVVLGPLNQAERIVTTARYPPTRTPYLDNHGRPVSILMAAMKDKNTQMVWDALPPRSRRHGSKTHV